jgi:peroxiredoxin Q/BCP
VTSSATEMLSAGGPAPAFELQDQEGRLVRLSDLAGRWVVLWWYPKASTAG